MENNKIIIEFDLGKKGGRHSFRTISEIQVWVNKEVNSFSWVSQQDSNTQTIYSQISQVLNNISQTSNNLSNISSELIEVTLNSMKVNIENLYETNKLIYSSTAKAKYINSLREVDPVVATNALGFFTGNIGHQGYFNAKSIEGFIKAGIFVEGKNTKSSHEAGLEQLSADCTSRLTENKNKLTESEDSFIGLLGKHNLQIDAHKLEFTSLLEKSNNDLINLTNTYDKHMAISAPVTYWQNREKHHHDLAKKFTTYAGLSLLFGLFFITCLTHTLLNFTLPNQNSASIFSLLTTVPFWKISIVILAISLFIWLERILVRLILSNLHSETDAGERVVMAKTYLSFLREGNINHEEDRRLILASLFRPNSTGIINDDAMPFNLERMQKMVGG